MAAQNRINPDPFKLQGLCRRFLKPEDFIQRSKNTVSIIPKDLSKSSLIYKNIISDIKKTYPGSNFTEIDDGNVKKIKILTNGYGVIKLAVPKKANPKVLQPGIAFELYFHSILLDGISAMKELKESLNELPTSIFDMYNNLTLMIITKEKTYTIPRIKNAENVGGKNKKTDEKITKKDGTFVNISLKQENFFSWGSAATFDPVFSIRPKKVLQDAINNGTLKLNNNKVIFPRGVDGIRVPATAQEVQKYAFGGTDDRIDYIVISAKKTNFNDRLKIIYLDAKKVYKNGNALHLRELQNDAYMIIRKSTGNASALRPYENVTVGYFNKQHAYNSRDNTYIDP